MRPEYKVTKGREVVVERSLAGKSFLFRNARLGAPAIASLRRNAAEKFFGPSNNAPFDENM